MTLNLLADFKRIRGDFQEPVTYHPIDGPVFGGYFGSDYYPKSYFPANYFGRGGIGLPAARVINAVVDRNPDAKLPPDDQLSTSPMMNIWVDNDVTTGISSAELNRGGDRIEVAEVIGKPASERTITRIVRQTAGWMQLEVR